MRGIEASPKPLHSALFVHQDRSQRQDRHIKSELWCWHSNISFLDTVAWIAVTVVASDVEIALQSSCAMLLLLVTPSERSWKEDFGSSSLLASLFDSRVNRYVSKTVMFDFVAGRSFCTCKSKEKFPILIVQVDGKATC